jgi:hypothetical protein
VELIGGDADPLLDEDVLRNALRVGVSEEFADLPLDWFDLVLARASLHFTLMSEGGYVARQRASEMAGMGSGVVAAPAAAGQIPRHR